MNKFLGWIMALFALAGPILWASGVGMEGRGGAAFGLFLGVRFLLMVGL